MPFEDADAISDAHLLSVNRLVEVGIVQGSATAPTDRRSSSSSARPAARISRSGVWTARSGCSSTSSTPERNGPTGTSPRGSRRSARSWPTSRCWERSRPGPTTVVVSRDAPGAGGSKLGDRVALTSRWCAPARPVTTSRGRGPTSARPRPRPRPCGTGRPDRPRRHRGRRRARSPIVRMVRADRSRPPVVTELVDGPPQCPP